MSADKKQVPIMNSTSTASSKIVIAVALAAVFGTAVYVFGVHSSHQAQVAQNIPAAPAAPPAAPAPVPPDPIAQAGADPTVAAEGEVTPPPAAAATPSARHAKHSSVSDSSSDTASTAVASNTATPPPPVASTEAAPAANAGDSDNRITSDVKTQVAAAAPNSNVNVTTTNGVVALAGSVPNQDAANQAKQAAMRVEGVKTVDTSGLLVNNNQ
jgi:hyperosmotically inducible periplasmic protein